MSHGDPLAALDARIGVLRTIRAAAERFSDAYWEADDTLSWLRMVRDEIMRTGRVRDELVAFLETPPIGLAIHASTTDLEPAALDVPLAALAVDVEAAVGLEPAVLDAPRPDDRPVSEESRRLRAARSRSDGDATPDLGAPIAAA